MGLKQKTILIVDDDIDILILLEKILAPTGLIILKAQSPAEARTHLSAAPHLILTDLHMEPEDGFSFIRSLKEDKNYQNIPVMVLSALNDFASVKKAVSLGIKDYVVKPLSAPVLLRKLRKVLLGQDFLRWDVPAGETIMMSAPLKSQVTALGETGYHLKGPFKLAQSLNVIVESDIFQELGVSKLPHRSTNNVRSYFSDGTFINDVTLLGVSETESSAIRKYIGRRRKT